MAVGVALAVVLAGYGAYATYRVAALSGAPTLTIYTYPSLLGGASCGSPLFDPVFGAFGRAHHVQVNVLCPSGTLVNALESQRNAPVADVVVGLDEITAPQADGFGLLVPYAAPSLGAIPTGLVDEISPDHAVTPYESGFLGIDYNTSFDARLGHAIAGSAFPEFAQNLTWAHDLVVEDPTTDITGEEFLAWQVEFYTQVLHQDWTGFWKAVDRSVQVAPDWGTAYGEFTAPTNAPPMAVSYLTDPAAAAFFNASGTFNSTVTHWNGTEYGWRAVYGLGIVSGTHHLALDRAFVDWFLSGTVQRLLPTSEWEIPANATIPLPAAYAAMPNATMIHALNDGTTPNATAQALTAPTSGWLDQWQQIANAYG
ncbi:MAG TPA: thiamine ABC transporter substrate-binding protein [Thermoplasmata archaeon]|nr:thiamine ABC transporter substrate-binding protein [Thermoplasmata archaeon]